MPEIWRPVLNYEGYYEVSNKGRVRSLRHSRKRSYKDPIRYMKLKPSKKGYVGVSLCKNGVIGTGNYLHRVVWEAFYGPIPEGMEINHDDGDKSNCKLSNLEICTHRQNIRHAQETGLAWIFSKGSGNGYAKLDEERVRSIKRRLAAGGVQRRIAKEEKVSVGTINLIYLGRTWKHVTI